jgi:hypothetical protein
MSKKLSLWFGNILLVAFLLCALAMNMGGVAAAQGVGARPCDLVASATPCVAAISTTRALYGSYRGPLYQVMRVSDQAFADIGLLKDGYANAAA